MNRHSLIVYISLFFLFLMGVVNTLFYFQYQNEQKYLLDNAFKTFDEARHILHMSHMDGLPPELANERLLEILQIEMLQPEETHHFRKGALLGQNRDLSVYVYQDDIYLYFNDPREHVEHVLRYYDDRFGDKTLFLFALAIDLSILLFFIYVIRRIWPLHRLKASIKQFSQGNLDVRTAIEGKDEIAEVAHEFDQAIVRIKQLQGSRNLFLRNIMHELKTPIAKGKLISDLMDDAKNAQRLQHIFLRFEFLLGEFSKIERVTSNEFRLERKNFRMVDIVDNALDILMLERDTVTLHIKAESDVNVDFELFSVALKNLIDNAIKYGTAKPEIVIGEHAINIISSGKQLDENIMEKVFNRKFEDSSKGLGLGLYITKNIVEKHGFVLKYSHKEGQNHFTIALP